MRPAIFFDCDGVLNEEPGGHGVLGPDDVRLIPGAGEAVRAAREAGYLAIIVTNRALGGILGDPVSLGRTQNRFGLKSTILRAAWQGPARPLRTTPVDQRRRPQIT